MALEGRRCPSCGMRINESKFCSNCGNKNSQSINEVVSSKKDVDKEDIEE